MSANHIVVTTQHDGDYQAMAMDEHHLSRNTPRVAVLVSLALLLILLPAALTVSSRTGLLVIGKQHKPNPVYTPQQATRAAKAAIAQLQLIEQRRPYAAAAANPLALPRTEETDLSRERRR